MLERNKTFEVRPWIKGKPIDTPGIYAGVEMAAYHSANLCVEPSISSSGLRTITKYSPAHYWTTSPLNPDRIEDEKESAALRFGRAIHDKLFSARTFKKSYPRLSDLIGENLLVGGEPWSPYRKDCKLLKKLWESQGKTLLKDDEWDRLDGITAALKKHELVKQGALDGKIELSMVWKDKETGVWLKSRPDVMPLSHMIFVDLKTTRDARPQAIFRSISEFGYYQQGALVAEGCEALIGQPMQEFYLLFAESEPPYCTALVQLKDNAIGQARRLNRAAIRKFHQGITSGNWPGPVSADTVLYAEPSEWEREAIDERLKSEGV